MLAKKRRRTKFRNENENYRMMMFRKIFFFICASEIIVLLCNSGFNELVLPYDWNGDNFRNESCPSKNIPEWLDGYFMIQISAAYGDVDDSRGSKIEHMFDAMGAFASLDIRNGQVWFTGAYYPSQPNYVWNYYNRNMSQTQLAWHPLRSAYNESAADRWSRILENDGSFPVHPNMKFWSINGSIVSVSETIQPGVIIDLPNLNVKQLLLQDTNDLLQPSVVILSVTAQERFNSDGSLYTVATAYDPDSTVMYHVVYKVSSNGRRSVEGVLPYEKYDPSSCSENGTYGGDKKILASYVHSFSSTNSYLIIPLGSNVINPCKLPPVNKGKQRVVDGDIKIDNPAMEFVSGLPVRILIFDKINKLFTSDMPVDTSVQSVFITNQINGYEDNNGTLVADMIGYENVNYYDLLSVDCLKSTTLDQSNNVNGGVYRLKINPRSAATLESNVFKLNADHPSYNIEFNEKTYKFAYALRNPFKPGNSVVKLDVQGRTVLNEYQASSANMIFREPVFVAKENGSTGKEDNGIVLLLVGDISSELSSLCILDAETFLSIGCSQLPTFVPFGFSSRFFNRNFTRNSVQNSELLSSTSDNFYSTSSTIAMNGVQNLSPNQIGGVQMPYSQIVNDTMYPVEFVTQSGTMSFTQEPLSSSSTDNAISISTEMSRDRNYSTNATQETFTDFTTFIFSGNPITDNNSNNNNNNNMQITSPGSALTVINDNTGEIINNINGNNNQQQFLTTAQFSFGPTTTVSPWLNLIRTGRDWICVFFKTSIDKSGLDFCQQKRTTS